VHRLLAPTVSAPKKIAWDAALSILSTTLSAIAEANAALFETTFDFLSIPAFFRKMQVIDNKVQDVGEGFGNFGNAAPDDERKVVHVHLGDERAGPLGFEEFHQW
jgi:hypothetical protein